MIFVTRITESKLTIDTPAKKKNHNKKIFDEFISTYIFYK